MEDAIMDHVNAVSTHQGHITLLPNTHTNMTKKHQAANSHCYDQSLFLILMKIELNE
jgi:hypothetical protein